jgi:hypothetical protein
MVFMDDVSLLIRFVVTAFYDMTSPSLPERHAACRCSQSFIVAVAGSHVLYESAARAGVVPQEGRP